ncbi:hypothetical protein F5Y14DRAFT_442568 [Nemania sp. NC0429]|nr:hypothetical protein F5Y14DRAFT_442568 [Nemania sp. NC0429]
MSISVDPTTQGRQTDSVESSYESDIDATIDFDETTGIATFPSGTRYSIHGLDAGTKDAVVKALSTSSKLALRGCASRGQSYVFLVSETIDYHVRTPYGTSTYDGPSCSCRQDETSAGLQHPCRHTLWLCDQILSQLVPLPRDPHTWQIDGYTTQHGNVCDFIADFHFDVLADGLRCDIMAGEPLKPRRRRVRTAREILATLSGISVDTYRPDLVGETREKRVVKEGDLEETIFRMLLENDSLLTYFLTSMRKYAPLNPKFRRFRDRADAALDAYDSYIKASDIQKTEMSRIPQWCYNTFKDISAQIKAIIIHSERELDDFDCRAAATTLVYILDQVVSRNEDHDAARDRNDGHTDLQGQPNDAGKTNLYRELVVESRNHFILDILEELPPPFVRHLLPDLTRIEQAIVNTDVPQSYLDKLKRIIAYLRRANSTSAFEPAESSRKRTNQDTDRYAKRVK